MGLQYQNLFLNYPYTIVVIIIGQHTHTSVYNIYVAWRRPYSDGPLIAFLILSDLNNVFVNKSLEIYGL